MVRQRIIETDEGIQTEFDVKLYDQMMRYLRDRGWVETELILDAGITRGLALGPVVMGAKPS